MITFISRSTCSRIKDHLESKDGKEDQLHGSYSVVVAVDSEGRYCSSVIFYKAFIGKLPNNNLYISGQTNRATYSFEKDLISLINVSKTNN